uniref:ATPase AAA-type core domain-containing protein n=1 Tax=Aegilops tauschii TaxID=37682 RepID=R7W2V7_AEGTA
MPAAAGAPTWAKASRTKSPLSTPPPLTRSHMHPDEKEVVIDNLMAFQESKEYYTKVVKAWKCEYLLYGSPGTGKSTMIAAMANFLEYDVYGLELTAIKNNTDLRQLFIKTTGKSIIVIEDIDCSVDLTGKRRNDKKATSDKDYDNDDKP